MGPTPSGAEGSEPESGDRSGLGDGSKLKVIHLVVQIGNLSCRSERGEFVTIQIPTVE